MSQSMLALVKFSGSSSFACDREEVKTALNIFGLNGQDLEKVMPSRHQNDAFRSALSRVCSECPRVSHNGAKYRVEKVESKTGDPNLLRVDFHLQKAGCPADITSKYHLIGTFSMSTRHPVCPYVDSKGNPRWPKGSVVPPCSYTLRWEENEDFDPNLKGLVPENLQRFMRYPEGLLPYGQQVFYSDLQALVRNILTAGLHKVFSGTHLIQDPQTLEKAGRVQELLKVLAEMAKAKASLGIFTLENTASNREALASEVSEELAKDLRDLVKALESLNPEAKKYAEHREKAVEEIQALIASANNLQEVLQVDLSGDYIETLEEALQAIHKEE